jgi:hypothetical protein
MKPALGRAISAASLLSFALFATSALHAQVQAPPNHLEYMQVESGTHDNQQPISGVVWSQFVFLPPETPWLRLHFHDAKLGKDSFLRITSVLDGATMLMREEHLSQWQYTSAFFNGNAVLVELVAGPNTTGNRVEIRQVMAGEIQPVVPETICGDFDNRALSSDARAGRIEPIGCTGWIIDYPVGSNQKVHLSAGHCFGTGQVLQFAVPASQANCALVFPPPEKQFAIDSTSSQQVNSGIGNDWWVFRCFPNSTTGLTSFQEQGTAFDLATALPALNTTLRNYGYGLDGTNVTGASGGNGSCSCIAGNGTGTRNQVQQTHTGPLVSVSGNRLNYGFDTCGGNSGSPVLDNTTGLAIGIHTNGGCTTAAGTTNSGTSILNAGLQAAIVAVALPTVPNDFCTSAIALGVGVNGPFQNGGGSLSPNAWPCGGSNPGRDVWFRFDADCGGSHTFSTCTATRTFDTVLQVFSGSCGLPVSLGCNDDACGFGSSLTVNLTAGTHYIRVAGYNQQFGNFDVVVTRPTVYDAGPLVTSSNGGSGGAPVSITQTSAPTNLTILGFTASTLTLADDFVTNGPWCLAAIELFAYQTGTLTPSINGVFVEVYNGDPRFGGTPVAGSPGLANNLVTTAGYEVINTMTGAFRATDSNPTDGTRPIQSVLVTLANPLNLNSASIAGGRYFLRWSLTGTGASGPFVPPVTVLGSRVTGDALQATSTGTWSAALSGGAAQGMPFKLYGTTTAAPGAFTNLGGGCSSTTLEVRGAPHVGGVVHAELLNPNPAAIPLIILGFTDPAAAFAPFCGCVQHATLDVVNVGTSYNWQVPNIPSGVGFELYLQGDQVFGPGLACDIGIGFRFELTDGYRIRLW